MRTDRVIYLLKDVLESIEIEEDHLWKVETESYLQDLMGCFCVLWGVPTRPTVKAVWKGPGIYSVDLAFTDARAADETDWKMRESRLFLSVRFVQTMDEYYSAEEKAAEAAAHRAARRAARSAAQ